MSKNFIPCVKWIRRGAAKSNPEVVHLSKEELKDLIEKTKFDIRTNAEILKKKKKETGCQDESITHDDDEFNMQDYDNDEDVQSLVKIDNLFALDDIMDHNYEESEVQDEEDSEKEDDEIKPTDNLIAVGRVHGQISFLEVYVYNEENEDLYVHHDIMLPSIPLVFEWFNRDPTTTTSANLLAIGDMSREISIWNMDEINSLEPLLKIGEFSEKRKHQHRNHGHRDAVLDLSWNPTLTHALASSSADKTVILWDLAKGQATTQFNTFQEKVQTIQWHPSEVNILLTGACDRFVRLLDCRVEETLNSIKFSGEIEKVVWHPTNHFQALVGTNEGELCCAELRTKKILWSIQAHSKEITGINVHQDNPDLLVTSSLDETVKLWNFTKEVPVLVNTKFTNQELLCLDMCPENPNIVCIGGDGNENNFRVYDLLKDIQVSQLMDIMEDEEELEKYEN